jgi:uncharacterized protein
MATDTKTRDEILELLRREEPVLLDRFKVKTIGLFGSFVRNAPHRGSDIDLLVEFTEPVGMFLYIDLEDHLSDLLGRKVDLVMKSALKPHIGAQILSEVAYP